MLSSKAVGESSNGFVVFSGSEAGHDRSHMKEVVCGVIVDGDGRVLACRRPREKHLGGLWEFPGGKVEPGESPSEALVRELREELAVGVELMAEMQPVCWRYAGVAILLRPYRCRIVEGEPQRLEHEELRWCDSRELVSLEWAAADLPIVKELIG